MTAKRDNSVDFFRAFGIICMIMGHVGFGDYFDHFIHAFHMPMFFFVTGYFYKDRETVSISKYLLKKCRTLIIPYLFFACINFLFNIPIDGVNLNQLKNVFWISTTNKAIPAGALWFLTALFFADVIYFFIYHLCKSDILLTIVVLLISAFGMYFNKITGMIAPWALTIGLVGILFLHVGRLVANNKELWIINYVFHLNWILWIVITGVTVVLIFVNGYINMRLETYANPFLFIINVMLSVIVIMNFSKWIDRILPKCKIKSFFLNIGKNSIIFVCLNQWFIKVMKMLLQKNDDMIKELINHIIITIITIICCYLLSVGINKTTLKKVIGK